MVLVADRKAIATIGYTDRKAGDPGDVLVTDGIDARRSGSCIQTVSGRGYRFVKPVTRRAAVMDAGAVEPFVPLANLRSPEVPRSPVQSAERRQLTLMICELAGSAMLASRLDPKELREIIAAYHRAVIAIVAGYDGFVGSTMRDTVLAFFGYPRAHEDDAERAVRAALGVIDAVGRLDLKSVKLRTCIGIATGLVVVGEGSAEERSVIGETPYLAARLKALAAPDTVVIGAGTHRLVGGPFEYRDLGDVHVEGIAAPVRAWQVLRPSLLESRFEALRGSALSPLVGRDEEIDLLSRRWAGAQTGTGQIVLICGAPGIGKFRITTELEGRLQAERPTRPRCFCSPYHQDSALYPFVGPTHATGARTEQRPGVLQIGGVAKTEPWELRSDPVRQTGMVADDIRGIADRR